MNTLQKLLDFLTRLDDAAITYTLERNRDDSITVAVSTASERWEVEFFGDGEIEVEVFYSNSAEEGLEDESALERLFTENDDDEDDEDDDDFDDDEDDDDFDDDEDEEDDDDFDDDDEDDDDDEEKR